MNHPSFLALDRHALGVPDPDTAAHIETCEVCAAHVRAVTEPVPVPDWVTAQQQHSPRHWGRWLALAAAALLAVGMFAIPESATQSTPYMGTKGAPEVIVYLQRDDEVSVWSGSAIRPGDQVRLGIRPTTLRFVTIRSQGQTLYAGEISGDSDPWLVPASWQVDDQGHSESLTVILDDVPGHAGPSPAAVELHLTLEKETP